MTEVPLLDISGLAVSYAGRGGAFGGRRKVPVIEGLDLQIWPGETLGVVGEPAAAGRLWRTPCCGSFR
ncbi:MAG: hypothetical protein WD314_02605 [Trueperaceae bacterium]